MKNRRKLEDLISSYAIEPYKEFYLREIKQSIRLVCDGRPDGSMFSRLGGVPELPEGIKWPINPETNLPFTFLAQLAISEIKALDKENLLPERGRMYFFYEQDYFDNDLQALVIFANEDLPFEVPKLPAAFKRKRRRVGESSSREGKRKLLEAQKIAFGTEFHIPAKDSLFIEKVYRESQTDLEPHESLNDPFGNFTIEYWENEPETTPKHHLLGHYKGIQNEMLQLELFDEHGIVKGNGLQDIHEALKWRLLLQMDTDPALECMFGDGGRLFFFIHEDDLKESDFSKVKIQIDSY
ncbi:MAG: YwqG family protein [Bacteroidia bacterium]|nr:YwqG family protein [Bacteroidia bacterium]